MRIKSYFAPSVQFAIALARHEFGDDVTLVTSHIASPESRHLGEYEVVFAIENASERTPSVADAEPAAPTKQRKTSEISDVQALAPKAVPETRFSAFQEQLLQAVAPPAREDAAQKLANVRASLIELGIDAATTRAVMALLEQCVGTHAKTDAASGTILSTMADCLLEQDPDEHVDSLPKAMADQSITEFLSPAKLGLELSEFTPVPTPKVASSRHTAAELAFLSSVSEKTEMACSK